MNQLFSFIVHPLISLNLWSDDDDEPGIDVFYLLSAFFAIGIWLVFERYQHARNSAKPFKISTPAAADPNWQSIKIDNPRLDSHLDNTDLLPPVHLTERKYITSFDPATSLHIATVIADNRSEIEGKIAKAAEAQLEWRHTTFTQRRRVMRSLKSWLVENQEACARVACRDTGKTLIDAALGEILTTCSKLEWLIEHGERVLRPERRASNWLLCYKTSEVHYEPLGVVAGIVSWNYPLHNAWSPIIAAIFAGNGIVLKCSEQVIWSSSWFVQVIQDCLKECGHNPELVQLVCCWPEEADTLTKSPLIKHITFIGSEPVGRIVARDATEHLTPVTLELGGKDPAVILPDTDLERWASIWMRGIFQNAGQNCIGIERLIVHSSQYDALREILEDRIDKLRLGSVMAPTDEGYISPVDCGSMISKERFRSLRNLIVAAEEAGAQIAGGVEYNHAYNSGAYFRPAIVGPATPEMEITQHELFAPIALLMTYERISEAIELANGTKYGLGASVFGPDQSQCLEVAKQLDCGMVSINDFGVFYLNQDLPFGGTKHSGHGRFGGPEGLRALTNSKAIMTDRWPALMQTSIPAVVDYPIRSLSSSWEFTTGLVRFMYAEGWRGRIRGLLTVIRVSRK